MIIAIDFDGTIVAHEFPEIGRAVPGAFEWIRKFKEAGAVLILWTMRSDGQEHGEVLSDADAFCRENGVEFDYLNENPNQVSWTGSPKAYANIYIDDAAIGCPLRQNPKMGGRPFVDWSIVGPLVMTRIYIETAREGEEGK